MKGPGGIEWPEPALTITVRGVPGPQGSKTHVGGGRMIESSAKVKPWRECVAWMAIQARQKARGRTITGPVALAVTFSLERPRSHYGNGRNTATVLRPSAPARPDRKPDVSKLIRSTEDALTTALVYRDDALVVEYWRLGKYYVSDYGQVFDVLDTPGAVIRVWPLGEGGAR
ncbi:RusA family crossover junction endodeoxyribonuclease [Streptomyces sp. NRRL B-1347]|uniref:RusA family crossover junction endodeoxyribonuclease n=1 Tax=Streptomyces sp. NRRL B-1347 TaxID=1476877 RepID=UPI0004C7788A|nr:RusA family crossover junction endodeoxyribonuclease [Streptomyces sp. NRRL B-1347]